LVALLADVKAEMRVLLTATLKVFLRVVKKANIMAARKDNKKEN
jgi:hypothetical protein